MSIHDLFDQAALEAIKKAAAAAEERTSGEVVTYVVERSHTYPAATLRGALLGMALGLLTSLAALELRAPWGQAQALNIALVSFGTAMLGAVAVRAIPALHRALAGTAAIEQQVARRAAQAFIEEEVFDTRERTGMLLFISRFERRVMVLGDAGINAKVRPGQWQEIVARVAAGIRARRPAEAVIEGIGALGALLETAGVTRREDDVDELANDVRLRDA